jgi:hypothetical protein
MNKPQTITRDAVQEAITGSLKGLSGVAHVFETTSGVVVEGHDGLEVRVTIALKRPSMCHTVEIIDDAMIVLDQDGNGCDCHELRGLREAKRQLRRWQDEYTFDYAEALRAVSEFFANQ